MFSVHTIDVSSTPRRHSPPLSVVCEGLLFRIFPQPADTRERGVIVAFTAAHAAAGVSEVTRMLARALRQGGDELAICLSHRFLLQPGPADVPAGVGCGANGNGWNRSNQSDPTSNRPGVHALLMSSLERLRLRHSYVLIDCPSVNETQDVIRLAPLVDGVVLVIEANRTRREQILFTERNIESVGGRILGHVLNKRTYAIPSWFHRVMTRVGV